MPVGWLDGRLRTSFEATAEGSVASAWKRLCWAVTTSAGWGDSDGDGVVVAAVFSRGIELVFAEAGLVSYEWKKIIIRLRKTAVSFIVTDLLGSLVGRY